MNKNKEKITPLLCQQSGVILPAMLIIFLVLSVIGLSLATLTTNRLALTDRGVKTANSLFAAESGAEITLAELNENSAFTGFSTEEELFNNSEQGRATYQTTVANGSIDEEKIITSTGKVYFPANASSPVVSRKIRLIVVGTTTGGYAAQTGPGGLIMTNSATIANGSVSINGYLTMSNSARIGSATNPVDVEVAHHSCPAGGVTYPSLCSSGQPVSISSPASIFGSVCATNQTNGARMSNPGLLAGCVASPVPLPDYDRQAQIDDVTTTITGSAASCSGNQTRTYNANTRINGNVSISNNCRVTVNGDVWVTGSFTLSNSAVFEVGSSVTTQPVIMVDGSGANFNNNAALLANSNSIGFRFITFRSAASCSPGCSNVTGTDLYNSRNVVTISLSNGSLAAGSSFYARWTKIVLSNSGSIGQILGQTVELSNSGNITFGSELSSGESVWSIKNYQQVFD